MDWQTLLAELQLRVSAGQVTTYSNCSNWAFRHRNGGQSVRSMLEAAAIRGNGLWTNRVVFDDGELGAAAHAHGQLAQLQTEGVPFSSPSRIDLVRCPPVVL
jgi:alkylated DNA nucleotide flippase Atl1